MKKLLTLMALLMLAVYAMPLITVGLDGVETDDIYEDGGAVLVDSTSAPSTGTPPREVTTGTASFESPRSLASYDDKTTLTVLIDGTPQTMTLHDYLVGVVAAEMPASFPQEALKAQALAARTYTLYKIKLYEDGMDIPVEHMGAQLCGNPAHCKAYCDVSAAGAELWGSRYDAYLAVITAAVRDTDGLIAVYEGQPIAAVFHAASGPLTESAVDVWGSSIPYLQSVESTGGEESQRYSATVTMSQGDFSAAVAAVYPEADFSPDPRQWFKASNRSEAGGIVDVAVGGVRVSGTFIRQIAGLNSTNFRVGVEGDDLIFTTQGYGHGVGMSQYGARALALDGYTYDQIIKHYFTGVELLLKS